MYVALGPNYIKLGQILDLGMRGLTFRYIAQRKTSNESSELEIFTVDHGFFLRKVPFTTVYDRETTDGISSNPLKLRKCCVEFGILTPFQQSQLAYCLDHYTTGASTAVHRSS